MKKILALLGMLTFSATAATSVVACNAPDQSDKKFAFDKEKAAVEDGSLHYYNTTIVPSPTVVNAKHAIVWRLQQHDKSFAHVTINDFTISTTSVDKKIKFITNDKLEDKITPEEAFANKVSVTIAPKSANSTSLTFANNFLFHKIKVQDLQVIKDWNKDESHAAHIFIDPATVTNENFKEVIWNAVLGEPLDYAKVKSNFEVTIDSDNLAIVNGLSLTGKAKSIAFTIEVKTQFTSPQTGAIFQPEKLDFQTFFLAYKK